MHAGMSDAGKHNVSELSSSRVSLTLYDIMSRLAQLSVYSNHVRTSSYDNTSKKRVS